MFGISRIRAEVYCTSFWAANMYLSRLPKKRFITYRILIEPVVLSCFHGFVCKYKLLEIRILSFLPSCLALAICTNCSKLALAKFWHHFPKPGKSFRTSWGTPRRHQGGRGLRASISSLCCNMWCTLHSIFYWIAILCRVYLCLKGFVSFLRRQDAARHRKHATLQWEMCSP